MHQSTKVNTVCENLVVVAGCEAEVTVRVFVWLNKVYNNNNNQPYRLLVPGANTNSLCTHKQDHHKRNTQHSNYYTNCDGVITRSSESPVWTPPESMSQSKNTIYKSFSVEID